MYPGPIGSSLHGHIGRQTTIHSDTFQFTSHICFWTASESPKKKGKPFQLLDKDNKFKPQSFDSECRRSGIEIE